MRHRTNVWCVTIAALAAATLAVGCKGGSSGGGLARSGNGSGPARSGLSRSGPSQIQPAQREPGSSTAHYARPTELSLPQGERRPQHTCPVDGTNLGAGDPVPVTIKGETFLVCCERCKKKVQQTPEKYVSKVRAETYARD